MEIEKIDTMPTLDESFCRVEEYVGDLLRVDTFYENHQVSFKMFCEQQFTQLLAQKNLLPQKPKNSNILSA